MPALSDSALKLRLERKTQIAEGVVSLEFGAIDGVELPRWEPGAHVELCLPSGLRRQYSLCGDPENRASYTVCVLREEAGRGGSVEVHDRFDVGAEIVSSAPRNHFPLNTASEYVLLAGGIGITPIKAMVEQLHRRGASWRLVYGGRNRQSMAFADELARCYSGRVTLVPEDEAGVPDLKQLVESLSPGTHLYCCGPAPMLDAATVACDQAGLVGRLHLERFGASGNAPDTSADSDFVVELRESGRTLTVDAGQSLLEAIRAVRPDIDSSCREGYCGTCETRVLEGRPDHRGTLLSPEEHDEEGTMLICVGRARSAKLVLDL